MVYELKDRKDIDTAMEVLYKFSTARRMLESLKLKYAGTPDPVWIYLNMAQRNLSLADKCIVDILPDGVLSDD